jgi:hypothetical protein
MHVFKERALAIAAAWSFLDCGSRDALEVGPMPGNPEMTVAQRARPSADP